LPKPVFLATFGADADKVHAQLFQAMALAGVNVPGEPAPAKSNVVACRIDKRDLDAIDALIEAGIRSTRSDAAAWLIHAGIEANKALFEKVDGRWPRSAACVWLCSSLCRKPSRRKRVRWRQGKDRI
jgi:hypothetical protein